MNKDETTPTAPPPNAAGESRARGGQEDKIPDVPLRVTLALGDITQVEAPVIVAGQYNGVAPLRAVAALDAALDFWISEATMRGIVGSDLGQLFFVPVLDNESLKTRAILLAGMGEFGQFTYESLCYLAMNVAYGVSNLGLDRFACVLIGSGQGALPLDESVKGLLSGTCDALYHLPEEKRFLKEFVLVENNAERYEQILAILNEFARENTVGRLALTVVRGEPLPKKVEPQLADAAAASADGAGAGARAAAPPRPGSQFVNRITIERGDAGFLFSALTDTAVVPVRAVDVQSFFVEGIASRLKVARGVDQQELGQLLHTVIFPEDFEQLIVNRRGPGDSPRALTLILDGTAAPLPWEMACFKPPDKDEKTEERIYFGTDLRLTRQFRTQMSRAPAIPPPVNRSLRVLVIADPAPELELQLEEARKEGEEIVNLLRELKPEFDETGRLDIVSRIGHQECDPVDILKLVVRGTFDVIHFSGHGVFDEDQPNHSGWVFGKKVILSAREIFRTRRVPRLVFANACFSAATKVTRPKAKRKGAPPAELSAEATNKKLAGLVEAFFERGVQNYVGTGWKVGDSAARSFAKTFYTKALAGHLLGDALAAARREIFDDGSTWGAYQHYGQSNARLTSRRPR